MQQVEKRQRGRPRAFNGPSEAASVQSLDRALRILAIVAEGNGMSLTEIAGASGIAAPTAYRMLTTLENHAMVEFDKTEQLWSIGVGTYRMGAAFLRSRKLVDRARTVMQELMETTGETANLGVAEDDCVVFVSQVETHQAIRAFFRPGTRSAFHASGMARRCWPISTASALRPSPAGPGWKPSPKGRFPPCPRFPATWERLGRAAGPWTTRSATPACAAWRRPSSTSSASRSAGSPFRGPTVCASRLRASPRSARWCAMPQTR